MKLYNYLMNRKKNSFYFPQIFYVSIEGTHEDVSEDFGFTAMSTDFCFPHGPTLDE